MSDGHGTSALGIEHQDQRAPDLSGVAQTGNEDIMADLPAAIEQLKAWAQAGKLIRYETGTLLCGINFMARLEPGSDGSFLIHGALEYGAAGMCGSIYPSHVEYVRVCREEKYVAVIPAKANADGRADEARAKEAEGHALIKQVEETAARGGR